MNQISVYGYTPRQALVIVQAVRKMPSMRAELPRLIKEFRAVKEFYRRQDEYLDAIGGAIVKAMDDCLISAFVSDKARTEARAKRLDPCEDCRHHGKCPEDCPFYD